MVVTDSKRSRTLNHSRIRIVSRHAFQLWGRAFFEKEDGEILANKVKESEFEIVSVEKKNEFAPKLFDLTGLQVYCNTKFGFTADETLKIVQTLYEQKWSPTQSRYTFYLMIFIQKYQGFWKTWRIMPR
jgi:DNA topoisomerase IA